MQAIQSTGELYAHAIAIEREAAERYSELGERMDDEGREDLARVFSELAFMEAEHLATLEQRTEGVALPAVPAGRYRWLENGAQAFFEHVFWTTPDPALRALAREMAAEERGHVELVTRMLEGTPVPLDATLVFERE